MKQTKKLWMLAAAIVLGLASCVEHDNPVDPNPLAQQVSGLWWTLIDTEGTLPENFSGQDYTRMGMAYQLNDDGTGYGVTFFFNDESGDPIYVIGGEGVAPMTYTTTQDGRISVDFGKAYAEYADYYKQFAVTYRDGLVTLTGDGKTITLDRPSDSMAAMIQQWDAAANGGASADNYNINDADFTPTNWREQEAIYIYDGTGQDATDAKGRTGYTLVNMPWYEGDVLTNLPNGFCDNITPENGWEWVLNRCGSRNIVNNNFFAVYNKYTGILRFFYYMPYGFNAGNDHVWQVSMTDHLAQHSLWLYGLPSDRILTNKAAVGQSGTGTFMEYVTPWVDYLSQDGLITPNAGWWAFDVDLSLYRPDDDISADNIKLQMRSWEKHTTSLYSTMTADIDGTLKADLKLDMVGMKSTSTAKGVLMGLQAAASVGSTIANFYTGNWAMGLSSLSSVFGTGTQLAGLGSSGPTGYTGSIDGTISLGLDGAINTDGAIEGSKATTGISSPTLYLKDFDLKNSHVGQGVWNLKTAPVVFLMPSTHYANNNDFRPYFFDPNIQLELNPNVFPEKEIEWMEVNAICTGKASMQSMDNDNIRTSIYGLKSMRIDKADYADVYSPWYGDNPLRDFLYAWDDKLGMKFPYTIMHNQRGAHADPSTETIDGRGINGFALEPQYWNFCDPYYEKQYNERYPFRIPFLEINVTVRVKMKGKEAPIVLSRNYLPEIVDFNLYLFNNSINSKSYAEKTVGHSELYDYQMQRIYDILDGLNVDYKYGEASFYATAGTGAGGREGYHKLLDGKTETKWCTNQKQDGVYFVEFMSREPITPNKYYLTTGNDTKYYSSRNPKSWKLMAKANYEDASWTTIATVTNDSRLPADNVKRVEYSLDVTGKQWQFFRFEISEVQSGDWIQLGEFEFDN